MTEDILFKMELRREAKGRKVEYDQYDKEIRLACKQAKQEWYVTRCEEIEELDKRKKPNGIA